MRPPRDDDFGAELDAHIQSHIDDNIRAGMTPHEARRQALIALGGVAQTTEAWRDRRSLPFTHTWLAMLADGEPAVDQDRFVPSDSPTNADRWASAPRPFVPEERVLAQETQAIVQDAIAALPVVQREVITLRDIEGRSSAEVCNTLGLTETNQRVLLHRARSRVRAALEPYLSERP